ncbi:serine hydrolase [Sphingomonas canadensis]|uniref:Serine hydrolase n=1 Tax=Sphingomonas canadensis TaxID=1219257 RepID=A0ABW3H3Z1_9SPHN|nr:serine hydrolase [Sphingomonas canadensis]MCW3834690.1 serine hydrolase [Sphingomonas canadensis]
MTRRIAGWRRTAARVLAALALPGLLAVPARAQSQADFAALDRGARAAMVQWGQPGLALAVVRKGAAPWLRGYGVRSRETGEPVDPATVFGIGSCSKTFAAASVALLVARGRLDWETRVSALLPWFQARDPWVTRELTMRDLLANRSGLRSEAIRTAATSRRSYLETVARSEPLHPFRANYAYSSDMFTVAGEAVAAAGGAASWEEFAARELWRPLGLADTGADYRIARTMADAATPYQFVGGALVPIEWRFEDDIALPAAGMNSSVRDLAAWLAFLLGERRPGAPALDDAILAETRQAQIPLRGPFNDSPFRDVAGVSDEAYGLGWFLMRYRGTAVLYHHGSQDGFRCFTAIVPELGLGFAALGNSPYAGLPRALFLDLIDRVQGRPPAGWSSAFLERQRKAIAAIDAREAALSGARAATAPPRQGGAYAGRYGDGGPIGAALVAAEGGALTLTIGRETFDLAPWKGDWFAVMPRRSWPAPRQALLEFRAGPDGRITGLSLDGHILEREQ